jgi:thiazole synthase
MSPLRIADRTFASRLLTGTGKYASAAQLRAVLDASGAEVVTMAIKRVRFGAKDDGILSALDPQKHLILPNTSGVRTAKEAIFAAELAREALGTSWLKLEIHPDPKYLMPDPVETLEACRELVKKGFTVLPYIHADPVLAKRLEEVGAAAVMPLGAPIGSNRGLLSRDFLGADAVLVNTAIASSGDPVAMARAFRLAVEAGRTAREAGLGVGSDKAEPTSPLTGFLD